MSGVYFNPLKRIFLNLSGGTVTGDTVFTQGLHAAYLSGDTIYSGSTELGFLISNLIFSSTTSAPYLPLSGGTVTGNTVFTQGLHTTYLSGDTIYSGGTNLSSIFHPLGATSANINGTNTYTGGTFFNQSINVSALTISTLVVSGSSQLGTTTVTSISGGTVSGGTLFSGSTNLGSLITSLISSSIASAPYLPLSGGTGGEYLFTGNTTGQTLFMQGSVYPTIDNNSDIGTTIKRFRNLNIVNGVSTNFTATTRVATPEVMLGNTLVTEYNIILSGYTLEGGSW